MAEGHGLRGLQMGKTWHHRIGIIERLFGECLLKVSHLQIKRVKRVTHPKPHIGGDLIITRARGVKPSRSRANDIGKPRLDIHMNIFKCARKCERTGLNFLSDFIEALRNVVRVFGLNDALFAEHGDMGL